jgi:hypothetical protein
VESEGETTQAFVLSMQAQRSVLGVGGRGEDFASQEPDETGGQVCSAVLVGVYEALLVPEGETAFIREE